MDLKLFNGNKLFPNDISSSGGGGVLSVSGTNDILVNGGITPQVGDIELSLSTDVITMVDYTRNLVYVSPDGIDDNDPDAGSYLRPYQTLSFATTKKLPSTNASNRYTFILCGIIVDPNSWVLSPYFSFTGYPETIFYDVGFYFDSTFFGSSEIIEFSNFTYQNVFSCQPFYTGSSYI
jgi:hypothetical protein